MQNILSQDEIATLLHGNLDACTTASEQSCCYDAVLNTAKFQLKAFNTMNVMLALECQERFEQLLDCPLQFKANALTCARMEEYQDSLQAPACYNWMRVQNEVAFIIARLDQHLISFCLEMLFGGSAPNIPTLYQHHTSDVILAEHLGCQLAEAINATWRSMVLINCDYIKSTADYIMPINPDDTVLIQRFDITHESFNSHIDILITQY